MQTVQRLLGTMQEINGEFTPRIQRLILTDTIPGVETLVEKQLTKGERARVTVLTDGQAILDWIVKPSVSDAKAAIEKTCRPGTGFRCP